jgi:hypothetical protein
MLLKSGVGMQYIPLSCHDYIISQACPAYCQKKVGSFYWISTPTLTS